MQKQRNRVCPARGHHAKQRPPSQPHHSRLGIPPPLKHPLRLCNSYKQIHELHVPPCTDSSTVALITPCHAQNFTYGNYQCTMKEQDYLSGIFLLLRVKPSVFLIQQQEIDMLLCLGEAPTAGNSPETSPPVTPTVTHPRYPHVVALGTAGRITSSQSICARTTRQYWNPSIPHRSHIRPYGLKSRHKVVRYTGGIHPATPPI